MGRNELERNILEAIYHGRHFSSKRDDVAIRKIADYIEGKRDENVVYPHPKGEIMEPRRSYRPAQPEQKQERPAAPPEPTRREEPRREEQQGKTEFKPITGFFTSKSGKSDNVFVTEAIVDKLREVQPGDTLGVSVNQKTNRLSLWYIPRG